MAETARQALVIGGGPAGLMAAGELIRGDMDVILTEAKPTVARKFLMAGKSGLNLTKDEPLGAFLGAYHGSCADLVRDALRDFGPDEVAAWSRSLGQEVFTGSSSRVFPVSMKGSPLLRAWIAALGSVDLRLRWRWTGIEAGGFRFDTPEGPRVLNPDLTILALGGASWSRLGSDGAWVPWLVEQGVEVAPFLPANAGLSIAWSDHMARHFGAPVKVCTLSAGETQVRGEFVVSSRGLEGSAIYAVSRDVREGAALTLDLCPDWSLDDVRQRLSQARGKATVAAHLRKRLKLDPVRLALLMEFGRPLPADLAPLLKALPVRHEGLRPLDEAISSAGGITAAALDGYRIKALPHTFAAGEMLDWEAPTGGYLLTACFATGRAAAAQALADQA